MQQTMSRFTLLPLSVILYLVTLFFYTESFSNEIGVVPSFESPLLVKRDQRTPIVATEFGEISAVQIGDGYHLQFITLEPNALLLPLLLHSDMVFFVHTGSGILNWIDDESERTLELRRGDVYRLHSGTVFYLHSNEVPEKLRVYAIFDVEKCSYEPCLGAYSSIRDLLLGFDDRTLQSAFAVPKEVLGRLRDATKPPLITNALPRNRTQGSEVYKWQTRLARLFVRVEDVTDHLAMKPIVDSNKKKSKSFNFFEADPDFENNNGRSIVVDKKDLHALKGSRFGLFMVNLTKGSMMGPHWNPSADEISIVLQGEGMIRVVNKPSFPSCMNNSERFMVEEGDVFVVPKFHPMAQMSFENSSFVFMGFSTSAKKNHPQFLVGKSSVLRVLEPNVLAASFNLNNETIKRLLKAQKESVMLECVSCAEGELAKLMREIEERKRREEEERKREEEEAKRREEEKRRREEEEAERRRKEEEEARKREEERKREAEEAKRREEEKRRREEEEAERRRKEEEEARKREEKRKREEEEAKRREEERKRREEEEEKARKREEEREIEEEMAKKRQEERQRKEREEVERKRREEQERKRREEEEMAKRREEERQRKEREEMERKRREEQERKRREEEEMAKRREEAMRRAEERKREEEAAKRAEEERRKREEKKRRWPPQPQLPFTAA